MLLCVLGRQPILGIAEIEALLGSRAIRPFNPSCAIVRADSNALQQQHMGGTIKIAEVISAVRSSKLQIVQPAALDIMEKYVIDKQSSASHKVTLGVSAYDLTIKQEQLKNLSFELKRRLSTKGISARVIVGSKIALNSAQVIHIKLDGEFGYEFVLAAGVHETFIAKTISEQDIESYSKRDYGRPGRDMQVGMLPPKLAQIMLNLASVGNGKSVLDPFCGTGVVLMEAALRNLPIMGSDINPKMVECTKENLMWLSKEYNIALDISNIMCADATKHRWDGEFDRVVCETYLGPPIQQMPGPQELESIVNECNGIVKRFLVNLKPQLKPDARCCIASPLWRTRRGFLQLPIIAKLEKLGYDRVWFSHARPEQLIYHRPDQIVARELLVLQNSKD